MSGNRRTWAKDAALRLIGLGLIIAAALMTARLYALVHLPPLHEGSPAELGLAALAFLSASGGATLAGWGHHIFERIAIAR